MPDRPRFSILVLEWAGLGLVATIVAGCVIGSATWMRQRVNAKIRADERTASALERIALVGESGR